MMSMGGLRPARSLANRSLCRKWTLKDRSWTMSQFFGPWGKEGFWPECRPESTKSNADPPEMW